MSVPDFTASIKRINDANSDFRDLLAKLRAFLISEDDVQISIGPLARTVPGIMKCVFQYRQGRFKTLILMNDDGVTKATLEVNDNGCLEVRDANGNLMEISCEALQTSILDNCEIGNVNIIGTCNIETLEFEHLTAEDLSCNSVTASEANIGTMTGDNLSFSHLRISQDLRFEGLLEYASRRLELVNTTRMMTYRSNGMAVPFRYSGFKIISHEYIPWYEPVRMEADPPINPDSVEMGYIGPDALRTPRATNTRLVPDALAWEGDFDPDDKLDGRTQTDQGIMQTYMENAYFAPLGRFWTADTIETVGYRLPSFKNLGEILGWPMRTVLVKGTDGSGIIVVTGFSVPDTNRIFYIRTRAYPWTVKTALKVEYNGADSTAPITSAEFIADFTVPPFSCCRFYLTRYDYRDENGKYRTVFRMSPM